MNFLYIYLLLGLLYGIFWIGYMVRLNEDPTSFWITKKDMVIGFVLLIVAWPVEIFRTIRRHYDQSRFGHIEKNPP